MHGSIRFIHICATSGVCVHLFRPAKNVGAGLRDPRRLRRRQWHLPGAERLAITAAYTGSFGNAWQHLTTQFMI